MENEQDIEKMGEIPGMPRPARVEIRYDQTLQKITGRACDPIVVSEGLPFLMLLNTIFFEHPEIPMTYPPGVLGFLLNDVPPKNDTPIFEGDLLEMFVRTGVDGAVPSPFRL